MRRLGARARQVAVGALGVLLALGLWAMGGPAQEPRFVPANQTAQSPQAAGPREADITQPYAVTPQAGTWMICAASYMGPNAPSLACQLAEQIRTKHRMPAYILNRANEERLQVQREYERVCRAAAEQGIPAPRRRLVRVEEQCAVLIGGPGNGWSDVDAASSFLKKVRQWPLPELRLENGLSAYDTYFEYNGGKEPKKVQVNPFQQSFVTRNPTVPQAAKAQNKFDPFWKKLNANEDYSLLKCPKPWTLVVKEYIGAAAVQPQAESSSFLDKIGLGSWRMGEGIGAAGLQAHHLAEFMNRLGFQAYVLHTRTSSIVTIGGFDSLQDPELEHTQDRLSRLSFRADPNSPNAAQFARTNLELFSRAIPMEVPRP
jgi:hypothetical protein